MSTEYLDSDIVHTCTLGTFLQQHVSVRLSHRWPSACLSVRQKERLVVEDSREPDYQLFLEGRPVGKSRRGSGVRTHPRGVVSKRIDTKSPTKRRQTLSPYMETTQFISKYRESNQRYFSFAFCFYFDMIYLPRRRLSISLISRIIFKTSPPKHTPFPDLAKYFPCVNFVTNHR